MRWSLSKPKRKQIYQHLPLRVNYSSVSRGCCMCCMEKRSGISVSLLSLGGPDWIICVKKHTCKRRRPRHYIRWLTVTLYKTIEIMLPATSANVFWLPLILWTIAVNNSRARLWNHGAPWQVMICWFYSAIHQPRQGSKGEVRKGGSVYHSFSTSCSQ